MKHWQRFVLISSTLIISIIIIQLTCKGPPKLPNQDFRLACLPVQKNKQADHHLSPYAQIAHTSFSDEKKNKRVRCYFRFSPQDLICIPKSVAQRKGINQCPQFPSIEGAPHKTCYVLNQKHMPLITLLEQIPPVDIHTYTNRKNIIVNTWQEARDVLLGKK